MGDVAARSGGRWSTSAIGSYERMDRIPRVHILADLARFYGVSVAWLVGDNLPPPKRAAGVTIDRTVLAELSPAVAAIVDGVVTARAVSPAGPVITMRFTDLPLLAAAAGLGPAEFLVIVAPQSAGGAVGTDDGLAPSSAPLRSSRPPRSGGSRQPVASPIRPSARRWDRRRAAAALAAWLQGRDSARFSDYTAAATGNPGLPSPPTFYRYFGSWAEAIRAAGWEGPTAREQAAIRVRRLQTRWGRDRVAVALADWVGGRSSARLAEYTAAADVNPDLPSPSSFYRHFGSWPAALRAAGWEQPVETDPRPLRSDLSPGASW